jgi:predicted DNA-binding transcriptional regulator AlpA
MTYEEIANELKYKPEYVRDTIVKRADFPRPAINLSQKARKWDKEDFEKWIDKQKKKLSR